MSFNTFGRMLRLTTWGESHGVAIGGVLDGFPPGIKLDLRLIAKAMDQRRPGRSRHTTQRREDDKVQILSGVLPLKDLIDSEIRDIDNFVVSTGTSLAFKIDNNDQRSKDYGSIKDLYRPGHADYTYDKKYGLHDYKGGGRSSARETAIRVAAGALSQQILKGVVIRGALIKLGKKGINKSNWDWSEVERNDFFCPDSGAVNEWEHHMDEVRRLGNSIGGIIEIRASGVPAGWGAPIYAKLDQDLASAMMSINAVKGVEIGSGFAAAELFGNENNDEMSKVGSEIIFTSNNSGGILGGISSGNEIVVRFVVKPTSSIRQSQKTLTTEGIMSDISTKGRHDPCVGIRAVPVGCAMMALVLGDHMLMQRAQTGFSGSVPLFELDGSCWDKKSE